MDPLTTRLDQTIIDLTNCIIKVDKTHRSTTEEITCRPEDKHCLKELKEDQFKYLTTTMTNSHLLCAMFKLKGKQYRWAEYFNRLSKGVADLEAKIDLAEQAGEEVENAQALQRHQIDQMKTIFNYTENLDELEKNAEYLSLKLARAVYLSKRVDMAYINDLMDVYMYLACLIALAVLIPCISLVVPMAKEVSLTELTVNIISGSFLNWCGELLGTRLVWGVIAIPVQYTVLFKALIFIYFVPLKLIQIMRRRTAGIEESHLISSLALDSQTLLDMAQESGRKARERWTNGYVPRDMTDYVNESRLAMSRFSQTAVDEASNTPN